MWEGCMTINKDHMYCSKPSMNKAGVEGKIMFGSQEKYDQDKCCFS